jgi:hypothetical protein
MEALFLAILGAVIAVLCWKCRISQSMIILMAVLGLFVTAYPGIEKFQQVSGPSRAIDYSALMEAGAVRPSVFNCASMIGNAPEESYKYADPKTDV